MTTYVYGSSDDLIEIDGSLSEEFPAHYASDYPYYLGFSDGTLLKVTYDGDWNIKIVNRGYDVTVYPPGTQKPTHVSNVPDVPDYSDVAVLEGHLAWVVGGTDVVK